MQTEKEEAALTMVGKGEGPALKPIKKEDQVALPGCTREGVVYALDCTECRGKGVRRQYIGETSPVKDFDYHVILFYISLYLIQTQSTPLKRVTAIVLRTSS